MNSLDTSVLRASSTTVLLVEDEPGDARLIEYGLQERHGDDYFVVAAQSLDQAADLLHKGIEPDVVLLDLNLPDSTGTDTVTRCRTMVDAPIVVITGLEDVAAIHFAISAGADDYLTKDCSGSELGRAIRYAIIRHQRDADARLAQAIFTHAREAIMITGTNGLITDVNEAFTTLTGYSRDQVLGKSAATLEATEHQLFTSEPGWQDIIAIGRDKTEVRCKRRDGSEFFALQTTSPVTDCRGRVTHQVTLFSDITLQKQHQRQLERVAHFDLLTDLPNRALFADRLKQAMASARRNNTHLGVVFIDLDGFKAVNDGFGHDVGDELLAAVATHMRKTLRETDTLARLAGDEFAAVLSGLSSDSETACLLQRLLKAIAQPCQVREHVLHISASIGLACYPQEDLEADQLLRQADQAMYQAKNSGKNRYHVFDPALNRQLFECLEPSTRQAQ